MRQFLEIWDKQRQFKGCNQPWADVPMFYVTFRCYRTGTARTTDSLGQGSDVYVLPECAAIADNAGLAPKILLVLWLFLPLVDLDGPRGQETQLGVQPPRYWILKFLPFWKTVYQPGDLIYPGNARSWQQKRSRMSWCINTGMCPVSLAQLVLSILLCTERFQVRF